jgi:two-component system sensor histidine kinase KdpD
MLRDGRAARRDGVDAVLAYGERHGRPATAAQLGDLEVLPTRSVTYRGTSFEELDVAGVLARRPALALVDELAHANLPGERHEKRWQDVEEILSAGIDVYTTLNIANLESLGPLIAAITGAHRGEAVPDAFVRRGEVRLVHLEPAALRHRLAQGLVFPDERADAALKSFFQFANLAALEELTALWLDETVRDPAATYRATHRVSEHRPIDTVVVALDGSTSDEWLISYGGDLATLTGMQLRGLYVEVADAGVSRVRDQLAADRVALEVLGGALVEVTADDVPTAIVAEARRLGACELIVGAPRGSRWSRFQKSRVVGRVLRLAGDLSVQVVNVGQPRPHEAAAAVGPTPGGGMHDG